MTTKNWQQVEQLLEEALKLTPEERTAFLETACAGDEELRKEVEAGLAKHGLSGNLTETVPMGPTVEGQAHRHTTSLLGRKLGPYEILAWLGEGGMGEVYKVQDSRLDRSDALKILPAEVAFDPERLKRFVREAKAASALNHPNIATIYEIGEAEGIHYIAMELVEGHTLANQLKSRTLEIAEILDIGIQVAGALETASKKGIIHRDIKPANIMLTSEGRVKVLDFGLAKITKLQGQAVNTITQSECGAIMGTLQYMSPEQMLGQEIDHRTDIFSLGVVLFEMTTGQRPFPASDTTQLIATILTQQPKRPSELNPNIPAALENAILKALEKNPEERYSSAHELRVELERLRLPAPVMADLSPSRLLQHYLLTPARRHAGRLTLSAGLLIITFTVLFWLIGTQPAISFVSRDWVLITDLNNQTGDPLFDKGLMTAFVTSIEQSTYVNVVPRNRIQAALRRMGKTEAERIDETVGREICLRDNIKGVITCGLATFGQKYVLSARIVDPQTGDTVRSYLEKTTNQEQLLTALDAIASKVRRDLGESYFSVRRSGRPLPLVTTSSLQALKLYTDGFYLFSRGKYGEGMELYRQALQHDPDFAMAHASLGFAYFSHLLNDPPKGKAEFEKALKNSERLTDRERLNLQASYKGQLGYLDEAMQLYNVYLRTYPDDTNTRYTFGSLLMGNRRFKEAIDQFKEVNRVVPNDANTYIQLATTYSELGQMSDSLANYSKAFELEPTWVTLGNLNDEYGQALIKSGNISKATEVFKLTMDKPEIRMRGLRSLALLDMYQGKYNDAKGRLQEAILVCKARQELLSEARNHLYLSMVLEGQGDAAGRLKELDQGTQCLRTLVTQIWLLSRFGVEYVRCGAVGKASGILERIRKEADPKNPTQSSDLHRLSGEIEIARGNYPQGLELLLLADRKNHTPFSAESLAHTYLAAGNTDQAMAWYAMLIEMRDHSLGWEPQQFWITSHYDLARIYSSHGKKVEAIKLLKLLFGLWKDADPHIPVLLRAKAEYSKLQ